MQVRSQRETRCGPVIVFLASLGATSVLQAADPAQDDASPALEPITVEATRLESDLEKVPAAISVVGKDDVQLGRQQLGLDESLVAVPGVFLQDRYNFAQDLRVSIRGFGARAAFGIRGVRIVVDGIPETLPDGQGGVDSIDLGSVQQIEVIRGPVSSLYGNASGGLINIVSERGPEIPFVESRLSMGGFDFGKYQLKLGGDTGPFDYLVNLSDMSFEGYRDHSDTENTQLNGNFGYQIDDSSNVRLVLNLTDQPVANDPGGLTREESRMDPTAASQRNLDFNAGEQLDQQKIGLVYTKSFGELHELQLRNYYLWRDFLNRLPFTDGGAVAFDRTFTGGGASYTYTGDFWGRSNRLIAGVDLERQDDDRERFDNDMGMLGALVFDQNEEVTSSGVFVQNEWSVLADLVLTLGLRHDEVDFEVKDRFLADGDDSGSRSLSETSPMIGLLYAAAPSVNLYAKISTAFETPTTTEFANPSGAGGFNPDIDPQLATNYEVGMKGTIARRTRYQAAVFTIDVEDELIPFELAGQPGRDFFANAGESSRRGVELALASEPLDGLRIGLAYTWSDFEFDEFMTDAGEDFAGNALPGVPEHLLYGEISWSHPSGFYTSLDALSVDEIFLDNANTETSDSYVVANLRTGFIGHSGDWEFAPFIGVNNVFDKAYTGNGRINAFGGRFYEPAPDRHIYGGISFRYDFGG
ncbi:TonB-dependent receptor [soil metagenome]